MLKILIDENECSEIRFSAIRYCKKFPSIKVKQEILNLAENLENKSWEYQAIATSALKSYPSNETFKILIKNISNPNWHVRKNSANSCKHLGYSYSDLINELKENDEYAKEIASYFLN
jgi:HEAT repeat protein